jgi:hypothetical protein
MNSEIEKALQGQWEEGADSPMNCKRFTRPAAESSGAVATAPEGTAV